MMNLTLTDYLAEANPNVSVPSLEIKALKHLESC